MTELEVRANELLKKVLRVKDRAQREEVLGRECADEPLLRVLVEALLRQGEEAAADTGGSQSTGPTEVGGDEKVGGLLAGRYRLAEMIGEGGMGCVYMAQQIEPVRRLVAVKVIKAGMGSKGVLARFEAERQVLAMMEHPNIARVLDAGATSSGSPFFVMELVKGVPITKFCEERKVPARERMQLFVQVCHALQHAHQKGIIHRDIKPSNVLVALYDDRPVPKVIDFGVAKAAGQPLNEGTLMTGFGALVGTPEYMSPEQATLNQLDIDTRSDVYSLGVLLYELLTGTTPLGRHTSSSDSLLDLLRAIREEEAPKPSTMVSRSATAVGTSSARHQELARQSKLLKGELDWILLKALEKDRARRYESANAFAQDIERHLAGEPVLAVPPSTGYRLRTTLRRHKGMAAAIAVVALSLVGGAVAFAWQARVARGERDRARTAQLAESDQRRQADEQRDRALEAEEQTRARAEELKLVADFQAEMLAQIDASEAGRRLARDVNAIHAAAVSKSDLSDSEQTEAHASFEREWSRVNATDVASRLIDETILRPAVATIDASFANQPLVDAQLRVVLAQCYQQIALYAEAMPLQQQALDTRRRELGEEHPTTLESMLSFGGLLLDWGKLSEAEPHLSFVLEKRAQQFAEDSPEYLAARDMWALLLMNQGREAEAESHARAVLEARIRVLGESDEETLNTQLTVSAALRRTGEDRESEELVRDALDKARRALGADHTLTLTALNNLGTMMQEQGRLADAETAFRELLETRRRVSGEDHPDTLVTLGNLGFVLMDQGKDEEAEPLLVESLELRRRVAGEDHPITLFGLNDIGQLRERQGRHAEAATFHREAFERRRRVLGDAHQFTLHSLEALCTSLRARERHREVGDVLREHLVRLERAVGEDHESALSVAAQSCANLLAQQRAEEAESMARALLPKCRRVLGDEHEFTLSTENSLGVALVQLGRHDEGLPLLRETLVVCRRSLGEAHPLTLSLRRNLMEILGLHGASADVEALMREQVEALRSLGEHQERAALEVLNLLGVMLQNQGRFEEAEPLLREVFEFFRDNQGLEHEDARQPTSNLAIALLNMGRHDEAEALRHERIAAVELAYGPGAEETILAFHDLLEQLGMLGRVQAVATLADEVFERAKSALGEDHTLTLNTQFVLARALLDSGQFEPSEVCYRDLVPRLQRVRGADHSDALFALEFLAFAVWMRGGIDESEGLLRELVERRTRVDGPRATATLIARVSLGSSLMTSGKVDEVEGTLGPILEQLRSRPADMPPAFVANGLRILGAARASAATTTEEWRLAEELQLEAHGIIESVRGLPREELIDAAAGLADFYARWDHAEPRQGHDVQAEEWRKKAGLSSAPK